MNLHHLPQSDQENLLLENAWLHYFNQQLFQTGLISGRRAAPDCRGGSPRGSPANDPEEKSVSLPARLSGGILRVEAWIGKEGYNGYS